MSSEAAAERVLVSVRSWTSKRLRLEVNAAKSGVGRPWEQKFLGFRLNREGKIEVAPESLSRFKAKVRELWRANQSRTSKELRDQWKRYVQGWWGYFRLAEERRGVFRLEGWIRRHIRKCFWLRWHNVAGRLNALRKLGLRGRMLKATHTSGAGPMARTGSLQTALNNRVMLHNGFVLPSDLAAQL